MYSSGLPCRRTMNDLADSVTVSCPDKGLALMRCPHTAGKDDIRHAGAAGIQQEREDGRIWNPAAYRAAP